MLYSHVFVSQKNEETLVFYCVNTRMNTSRRQHHLCGKHGGRDKTWEITWQLTYRHVLLC